MKQLSSYGGYVFSQLKDVKHIVLSWGEGSIQIFLTNKRSFCIEKTGPLFLNQRKHLSPSVE